MFISERKEVKTIQTSEQLIKKQINEIFKISKYNIKTMEELAVRMLTTVLEFRKEVENDR